MFLLRSNSNCLITVICDGDMNPLVNQSINQSTSVYKTLTRIHVIVSFCINRVCSCLQSLANRWITVTVTQQHQTDGVVDVPVRQHRGKIQIHVVLLVSKA